MNETFSSDREESKQSTDPAEQGGGSEADINLSQLPAHRLTESPVKKPYPLLIYVALALATFVAFEQLRNNEFIDYDDDHYVTKNQHVIGGITRDSVSWAFTTTHAANWHPLTWLSHMLDCELFGLHAGWHHLTSLFFHIANALLLFWVLNRMTKAVWPSAFVAALFALHPLHVESVAWVSERKDVLSSVFWMLTMAAYVMYAERPGIGRYMMVFLALGLGLMAKPMLVTLPFVLLLLDFWPLGRFPATQPQLVKSYYQKATAYRLIGEKIPLFVLSVASCAVTYAIQKSSGTVAPIELLPLNARIAGALVSYVSYIGKMIYPTHLAVLYPHRYASMPDWQPSASFIILTLVSVATIYAARQRRRYLAVGWLWYIGTLVPVIGLVQVGPQAMADRYTYLPSIGLCIILAFGAAELLARPAYRRIVLAVLAALTLAALLIGTRKQVRYWRNSLTLFKRTLAVTKDNYTMHNAFAFALSSQGKLDEAVSHYRKALDLIPYDAETHLRLADTLRLQGELNHAISHYRQAIRNKPDYAKAHNDLAYALRTQSRLDEAVSHFRQALETKPDLAPALNGLAQILAIHYDPNVQDANEAVELASRAAELTRYDDATILDTLATTYAATGHFDVAVETAQKALTLATAEQNDELVNQIGKRLELFRQAKPYQLSAPSSEMIGP
ncbi:MAG: tetratricopeptide repeat protein [Planctomycetota bacterium]|nr:MAG: tetratricopeptide repeat protein [Planctomycetota bacterium]